MSKSAKIGDRIRILRKELGGISVRSLEMGGLPGGEWLLSNGLTSKWEDKTIDFTSTDLEVFLNHYNINREWWKTLEGPIFNEKPTHDPNKAAITENALGVRERETDKASIIRAALRDDPGYVVMPKSILEGKYTLYLETEITQKNELLWVGLRAKDELINQLKEEIQELRGRLGGSPPQKT